MNDRKFMVIGIAGFIAAALLLVFYMMSPDNTPDIFKNFKYKDYT